MRRGCRLCGVCVIIGREREDSEGRTCENVAVFVMDVAGDEGREEGQEEVPEPVGGGR